MRKQEIWSRNQREGKLEESVVTMWGKKVPSLFPFRFIVSHWQMVALKRGLSHFLLFQGS